MTKTLATRLTVAAVFITRVLGATSGEFNVLSMNVAGLPAILQDNDVPGDKETNSETIGSLFAEYGYDIIHVQEGQCLVQIHILRTSSVVSVHNN